ncbi:hypothetical protein CW670_10875 [Macrococcoides caseolyticum]|uniref:hypothetical protein n=1 Tax=Macrococcoides caseolyticum TaxID=69966 RepID=UPI000C3303E7|nr:hypothetical protein [Macrococcus caseolyticus]PKE73634.1 hypothetical protein CW670_10875 [Macrococcus caseolyticus]
MKKEITKISLNIEEELKEDLDYLKSINSQYSTRNALIIAILKGYRDNVFQYIHRENEKDTHLL